MGAKISYLWSIKEELYSNLRRGSPGKKNKNYYCKPVLSKKIYNIGIKWQGNGLKSQDIYSINQTEDPQRHQNNVVSIG